MRQLAASGAPPPVEGRRTGESRFAKLFRGRGAASRRSFRDTFARGRVRPRCCRNPCRIGADVSVVLADPCHRRSGRPTAIGEPADVGCQDPGVRVGCGCASGSVGDILSQIQWFDSMSAFWSLSPRQNRCLQPGAEGQPRLGMPSQGNAGTTRCGQTEILSSVMRPAIASAVWRSARQHFPQQRAAASLDHGRLAVDPSPLSACLMSRGRRHSSSRAGRRMAEHQPAALG